jgi:hypothetical protein
VDGEDEVQMVDSMDYIIIDATESSKMTIIS